MSGSSRMHRSQLSVLSWRSRPYEQLSGECAHLCQQTKMIQQALGQARLQKRLAAGVRDIPVAASTREANRLPLSTEETKAGGSGCSVRVSYQFRRCPRYLRKVERVARVRKSLLREFRDG